MIPLPRPLPAPGRFRNSSVLDGNTAPEIRARNSAFSLVCYLLYN